MATRKESEDRCTEYLQHLRDVFTFLVTSPGLQVAVPKMHRSCSNASSVLAVNKKQKGGSEFHLSLEPNWEIPIDSCPVLNIKGSATLVVGGTILQHERHPSSKAS